MKIFHISDLHIGKQLHGFSLIEDQHHILLKILEQIERHRPDVLLIAGDVYDKSIPSTDAVELLDNFLTHLSQIKGLETFIISGNHDSDKRLDFASRMLTRQHIHLAAVPPLADQTEICKKTVTDTYGTVNFYLIPFIRPSFVRERYPDREIKTYEEAFAALLSEISESPGERNVLVAHQFFVHGSVKPEESESETFRVGGQDSMDTRILGELFDYTALGHLHAPQKIGKDTIRYSGSPLKYAVSEEHQRKSITMVELREKGTVIIEEIPLVPLREVRRMKGTLEQVLKMAEAGGREDYISVVLTDEEPLYEPKAALVSCYPNLCEWSLDNSRTRHEIHLADEEIKIQSPMEAFEVFYQQMHGTLPGRMERKFLLSAIEKAGGV